MRKRLLKKSHKKAGSSPGTLIHVGEKKMEEVGIRVIGYDGETLEDHVILAEEVARCCELKAKPTVAWVNVDGIHRIEVIESLGKCFELHPLVMEDILNTEHRPKLEEYPDYLFIVLKILLFDEAKGEEIRTEQVSLILGKNFVLSFQECEGDVFNGVRERIRNHKGRIRNMGADYLAYALLDSIVDSYFSILEKIGDRIELLEEELLAAPGPATLQKIHHFRREMILLRKSVWPLREVISGLQREETLVREPTRVFLRDVYDHTIQVIDTVETFRDLISGMLDLYLSSISNRMNEVMKVLTIIATLFIPLTFIVGVYGMNFDYMPELGWRWAYFALWGVMLALAYGMLLFFRRKKWL